MDKLVIGLNKKGKISKFELYLGIGMSNNNRNIVKEIKELQKVVAILEYRVKQLEKRIDVKFDLNEFLRDINKNSKENLEKLSKLPVDDSILEESLLAMRKKTMEEQKKPKIDNIEDLEECMKVNKIDIHCFKNYREATSRFIREYNGREFGTGEFKKYCGIGNSTTVQKYLKMLKQCKIIVFIRHGVWQMNIR